MEDAVTKVNVSFVKSKIEYLKTTKSLLLLHTCVVIFNFRNAKNESSELVLNKRQSPSVNSTYQEWKFI